MITSFTWPSCTIGVFFLPRTVKVVIETAVEKSIESSCACNWSSRRVAKSVKSVGSARFPTPIVAPALTSTVPVAVPSAIAINVVASAATIVADEVASAGIVIEVAVWRTIPPSLEAKDVKSNAVAVADSVPALLARAGTWNWLPAATILLALLVRAFKWIVSEALNVAAPLISSRELRAIAPSVEVTSSVPEAVFTFTSMFPLAVMLMLPFAVKGVAAWSLIEVALVADNVTPSKIPPATKESILFTVTVAGKPSPPRLTSPVKLAMLSTPTPVIIVPPVATLEKSSPVIVEVAVIITSPTWLSAG